MALRKPAVWGANTLAELPSTDTLEISRTTGFLAENDIATNGVITALAGSGYSLFVHDVFLQKHFGLNDATTTYVMGVKGLAATDTARFWATQQMTVRIDASGTGAQAWGWSVGNNASGLNGSLQLLNITNSVTAATWESTTGNLALARAVRYSGVISPTSISTSQNNYSPTDWATSSVSRINATTNLSITGFAATADGDFKYIHAVGAGQITLAAESASSTAANRIAIATGNAAVLRQHDVVCIQYDGTSQRWRLVGAAGLGTMAIQNASAVALTGAATISDKWSSTNGDTRLLMSGGSGPPTKALSLNYSAVLDATGNMTWQRRTSADAFEAVVGGYLLGANQWFFGSAVIGSFYMSVGGNTGIAGNLELTTAGNGIKIKEGSNATMGVATLVAGLATVSTTKVTANSRIFLEVQSAGGIIGTLRINARTAGTSFQIASSSMTETSVVAWIIFEPS